MRQFRFICCMVCMISFAVTVRGQQASHWHCDVHAYQYDMSVYLQLRSQGKVLSDYSDYEIAAFCEDECRGVATVLNFTDNTGQPVQVARIRVRSNKAGGETFTIRAYQHTKDQETAFAKLMDFESMSVLGRPDSPIVFSLDVYKGDANEDGITDVTDIVVIANYILGQGSNAINTTAADVNGDGVIDVTDIVGVANLILNGNSAKARQLVNELMPQ